MQLFTFKKKYTLTYRGDLGTASSHIEVELQAGNDASVTFKKKNRSKPAFIESKMHQLLLQEQED